MRLGCLLLLFALCGPITAAYLHASWWWLVPAALVLVLSTGDAIGMIGAGVTPGTVILWLIALPSGIAFLLLYGVYRLAERLIF